ncbi:MAG: hypothetical protein PHW75_02290, partial [Patescibacteria group bacterium]|nr:hypothetical protein [Patescibacteria group bacterium]
MTKKKSKTGGFKALYRKLRLKIMELQYLPHLEIRLVHDKTYAKNKVYKKWTDTKYSSTVHKAVLVAFIASFVFFQGFQYLFPYLNLWNPREAQSASTTVTWSTQADFDHNAISGGIDGDLSWESTRDNTDLNMAPDSLRLGLDPDAQPTGNGLYTLPNVYSGQYPSVSLKTVIDFNNRVHLFSYEAGTIKHIDNTSGSWVTETIDTGSGSPAVGVLSDNTLVIAYSKNSQVIVSRKISGVWQNEIIDQSISVGDIKVSSTDKLYITYFESATFTYKYLTNNTGSWTSGAIAAVPAYDYQGYSYFNFALGPGNSLNSCYGSSNSPTRVNFKTNSTTSYITASGSVKGCRLAIDSAGNKHTAFFSDTTYGMYYAFNTTVTTLGTVPSSYLPTYAIALDSNSKAHVVYVAYNSSNILEFTNESGSWQNQTLFSSGGNKRINSLVMGPYSSSNAYYFGDNQYHHLGLSYSSQYVGYIYYWNDTPDPYYSPATLGSPTASSVGLRADTGTNEVGKAKSLSWDATTDAAGQKVLFKVRVGDSQAELDDNICYGPGTGAEGSGLDEGCDDWSTAGKFFSQIYGESNSSTAIDTAIENKRYIEVLVRLESSGANTPVLNEVVLTYDTLDAPDPNTIQLTKSDDSTIYLADGNPVTAGLAGGYTNESGIKVATSTAITCEDCGTSDNRVIEVEVQPVGTPFTDTPTETGSIDNVNYLSAATISGLSPGQYHIQYRASDGQGRQTAWTSYGSNAEDAADFTIEQTPPTISSFTINSGNEFTSSNLVTLNIEAADSGSKLGKIYASNNGTDWTDVTAQATNFIGQASFTGDITNWDIGTGDGEKNVYVRLSDNAGNTSGTIMHSVTADFDGTLSLGITNVDDELKLVASNQIIESTSNLYAGVSDISGTKICTSEAINNSATSFKVRFGGWYAYSLVVTAATPASGDEVVVGSVGPTWEDMYVAESSWMDLNDGSAKVCIDATPDGYIEDPYAYIDFGQELYPATATYTSSAIANSGVFSSIGWNDTTTAPNTGVVTMKVRGADTSGGLTSATWSNAIAKNDPIPDEIKNKAYVQYQLTLASGNSQTETPIVQDVSLQMFSSAT